MTKFSVSLICDFYGHMEVQVEAPGEDTAQDIAREMATQGKLKWSVSDEAAGIEVSEIWEGWTDA